MNLFSIADSCQKIFFTTLKNLSKYKSLNFSKTFTFPHGSNQILIYVTVSTGLIFAANQSNDANVSVCRSGLERFSYYTFINHRSIILFCMTAYFLRSPVSPGLLFYPLIDRCLFLNIKLPLKNDECSFSFIECEVEAGNKFMEV